MILFFTMTIMASNTIVKGYRTYEHIFPIAESRDSVDRRYFSDNI